MTDIAGATAATYTLVTADLGYTITAAVTATNAGGSASATSSGVGPIAAAPFTPTNLTGLIGWWDANVFASITQSAGVVVNFADQSGVGNHLGDGLSGGGFKPTYSATGFNSKPGITFSGGQYLQSTGVFNLGTGNTVTVFAAATLTSGAGNFGRLLSYRGSGATHDYDNAGSFAFDRNATNAQICLTRSGTNTATSNVTYATPCRMIGTISSAGVTTVYVNGAAVIGATLSGNWVSGGILSLGVSVGDSFFWGGAVAEAGIATGFTNSTDVASLDLYLKNKWGL